MFDRIDAAVFHPTRNAVYFFRGSEYLKYVPSAGVQSRFCARFERLAPVRRAFQAFRQSKLMKYLPVRIIELHAGSKIRRLGLDGWRSLPPGFRSDLDAALYYPNGYIYFFKGSSYVKYKPGEGIVRTGSGGTIRTIGVTGWRSFPDEFRSNIDAAIYYPYNGHVYFFKGTAYIKYKPGVGVIDFGGESIRQLGTTGWSGLPDAFVRGLDAAVWYPPNERLYFFKDREYVRWNPGKGPGERYPRRSGLRHRNHGGWPGLSTVLGGPFVGDVTSDSASLWVWLTGGKTTEDLLVRLDGAPISPEYTVPPVGTAAADVVAGVHGVDLGSVVRLLRFRRLRPNTRYEVELRRADDTSLIEMATFKTAPSRHAPAHIRIGLGSCANSTTQADLNTFEATAKANLDLLILCGDNCYYYDSALEKTVAGTGALRPHDWSSVTKMLVRQLESRNHPQFVPLARKVAVFSTWDDHDFSYNNCDGYGDDDDPRWVGRDRAAGVYRMVWNHPYRNDGNHIYYDFRWGPLHVFVTDGRYHSKREDYILGYRQLTWLLSGLQASDAPIKLIVLGGQLIRVGSPESFGKAAAGERSQILDSLENRVSGRILIFSGDIHRSECQRHPNGSTKPNVLEVTSSPLRVRPSKNDRDFLSDDGNRLWQSYEESFAVIDIDYRGEDGSAVLGSVKIQALDEEGVVLESQRPSKQCHTEWNLRTGELT